MPEVIIDNLDLWTSALLAKSTAGRGSNGKLEAYGIKKLRELILELAVRGRLVPQDPKDEPASALLKKVEKEKARLVQAGKIVKQKPLPPLNDEEKYFDLPNGWEWIRFGNIFELEYGSNLPEAKRTNTGEYPVYGSNGVVGSHKSFCVNQPCIVVGRKGSAGALNLCLNDGCWVTDVAYSVVPPTDMDLNFVFKLFHTLGLDNLGKGIKPGLNRNEAYVLPLAIPPLNEQQRIVAKVDELMALCDQLEQQQTNSIAAHQTMVETLLGTLTCVESQQEFSAAWARIASHFDTLFNTEASIDQLKQTILQLAVMGKLVPQDSNDENVQALLVRNDLRRREVAESDRRADVEPQNILSPDDRWAIPASWDWRGLADLVLFVDYRGKTPIKQSRGIRLLTAKNVRRGQIDLMPEEFLAEQEYKDWMTRGLPKVGDVLFTTEAPMGNAAVVELTERFALAQRVICFQNYGALDPAFLVMQILSNQFQCILDKNGTGMTAKGIKASKLKQLPIAVPPLTEQHRIVAKVDEIMALCDALKARLADAKTTQIHLADAIVEQAVC